MAQPLLVAIFIWICFPFDKVTGRPNSEAVQIYNEKAALIIGVRVGADGQAEDVN